MADTTSPYSSINNPYGITDANWGVRVPDAEGRMVDMVTRTPVGSLGSFAMPTRTPAWLGTYQSTQAIQDQQSQLGNWGASGYAGNNANYGGQFGRWQFSNTAPVPKTAPVGWGRYPGVGGSPTQAPWVTNPFSPGVGGVGGAGTTNPTVTQPIFTGVTPTTPITGITPATHSTTRNVAPVATGTTGATNSSLLSTIRPSSRTATPAGGLLSSVAPSASSGTISAANTGVPNNVLPRVENFNAPVAPITTAPGETPRQNLSLTARFGALNAKESPVSGETFMQYAQRMGFPVGQYGPAASMAASGADPSGWYGVLQSFYGA